MKKQNSFAVRLRSSWLLILIAAQPVLDVLAYWTNNTHSSWAGYIRLAIMVALPLVMLVRLEKKKHFLVCMLIIGTFCVLHILNCFRVGYIDPVRDISYMARVAQMPVLTVCFVYALRDERMKNQAVRAMEIAAGLVLLSTVAPYILYTKGLANVESGKASIMASIEPVVGTLVGTLVFGEPISAGVFLGLACILACVYILR